MYFLWNHKTLVQIHSGGSWKSKCFLLGYVNKKATNSIDDDKRKEGKSDKVNWGLTSIIQQQQSYPLGGVNYKAMIGIWRN